MVAAAGTGRIRERRAGGLRYAPASVRDCKGRRAWRGSGQRGSACATACASKAGERGTAKGARLPPMAAARVLYGARAGDMAKRHARRLAARAGRHAMQIVRCGKKRAAANAAIDAHRQATTARRWPCDALPMETSAAERDAGLARVTGDVRQDNWLSPIWNPKALNSAQSSPASGMRQPSRTRAGAASAVGRPHGKKRQPCWRNRLLPCAKR
ncbi:hypothetical protein LMG23994_06769 [Cupriavidus pinatubonensis]|uniref:Uncharacterized protein n=1 Tax=Cupriavidus pinatubonensis TaxID=248026 RepID=A0ABM8Y3I1_9BURK|nr:hypothetical protein LMG23994_06769 [Cupriavidus pinatubonensis]